MDNKIRVDREGYSNLRGRCKAERHRVPASTSQHIMKETKEVKKKVFDDKEKVSWKSKG